MEENSQKCLRLRCFPVTIPPSPPVLPPWPLASPELNGWYSEAVVFRKQ